jgi:hypothetical protein
MKRNNRVSLDGVLRVQKIETVDLDGKKTLTARCIVSTDLKELGGHHLVLAYNRQATETIAFGIVGYLKSIPMEVSIDGYLWCTGDVENNQSVVVADRVVFRCGSDVRAQAVDIYTQITGGNTRIKVGSKLYLFSQLVTGMLEGTEIPKPVGAKG